MDFVNTEEKAQLVFLHTQMGGQRPFIFISDMKFCIAKITHVGIIVTKLFFKKEKFDQKK